MPPHRVRWIALAVFLVSCAVFAPALRNGFVDWDDEQNFLQNPHYRGLGPRQLLWMLTTFHSALYQPLTWLSLGLDHALWGMDPAGYHLTSVLLHAVAAALFFLLCRRLLRLGAAPSSESAADWAAAAAALLFALHPLRVESVVWISERRDVLSGALYLATLLAYLRSHDAEAPPERRLRDGRLALAAFAASLLSKGIGVSLPFALLVLDVYPLRRLPADPRRWGAVALRPLWKEKLPYLVLALVIAAIGLAAEARFGTLQSWRSAGLGTRLAQWLYSLGFYIWRTLLPLELLPLYKLPSRLALTDSSVLFYGAVAAAAAGGAFALRRRIPAALAAFAFYAITLFPVSGLIQFGPQLVADRYSYLSCLGWAALAGAGLLGLAERLRRPGTAAALGALALCACAVLTVRQTRIWRDAETLWRHVLSIDPLHGNANNNLGRELIRQGRLEEASAHFEGILARDPVYLPAHSFLGLIALKQGRLAEAEARYRRVLELAPDMAEAHSQLGAALARQERFDEALAQFRKALELDPREAYARRVIDEAARRASGRRGAALGDDALEAWHRALQRDPSDPQPYRRLAEAYRGRGQAARARLFAALARALSGASAELDALPGLVARLPRAQRLEGHSLSAFVYYKLGRLPQAQAAWRESIALEPDQPGVLMNLYLTSVKDDPAAALGYLRRYVRAADGDPKESARLPKAREQLAALEKRLAAP